VTAFSIVRLGADTHVVNNDQRRIALPPTSSNGGTTHQLTLPADRGVVLPGYYMLFAMDANGVPSIAKSLRVS
jgi:galactose oxidase